MKEKGIFNLQLIDEKLVGNFAHESQANVFYPEGAKPLHGLNPNDPFLAASKQIGQRPLKDTLPYLKLTKTDLSINLLGLTLADLPILKALPKE